MEYISERITNISELEITRRFSYTHTSVYVYDIFVGNICAVFYIKMKGYDVMKYRKKPVVVEAYQTDKEVVIHTLEGDMTASVGDYIITGVNGEQYPCKPDIFEKTYEPVSE